MAHACRHHADYNLIDRLPWHRSRPVARCLVRRADGGEKIVDTPDFSLTPESNEDGPSDERIEALAEIICHAGDESAAALFVLMGIDQ